MRLAIVGTGYVGLVAAAGFAELGHDVACIDVDADRIAALGRNEVPFYEPGLAELVLAHRDRLRFTTSLADAIAGVELAIVAVGTPSSADGTVDLRAVEMAVREIASHAPVPIAIKSTVPVGTAARMQAIAPANPIFSNPEFLKEGDAVRDFRAPSRIVIGVDPPHGAELLRALYAPLVVSVREMSTRSAELAKYGANAMLATRISFMNDLARLADAAHANIDDVRVAMADDPRIGAGFLGAGVGYGGSCLPKDVGALLRTARSHDLDMPVVAAASAVNERQRRWLVDAIAAQLGSLRGSRIAIWGLAFKPGTDDLRCAPSLALIAQLRECGARVAAHDPISMSAARALLGETIELCDDPYAAATAADAVALVTEWPSLVSPDFARLAAAMRGRALFDGRNAWNATQAKAHGFSYRGLGRTC